MALPDLHKFENDLKNKPGAGDMSPPRTIKAKKLDDNYRKVTLVQSNTDPPLYDLEYTKDGTRLTRLLPDGENAGDVLYWNGSRWVVLAAAVSATLHVLTIQNGALAWTATEECA